jgi:hypothetical protein
MLALGFHPEGKGLAAGDSQGNISYFDLTERRETLRLEGAHPGGVGFIRMLASGRMLSGGVLSNAVRVWEPASTVASAAPLSGGHTRQIAFSRDDRWLVLLRGTPRPSLLLLDRQTGKVAPPLALGSLPDRHNLVFRADSRQLALV